MAKSEKRIDEVAGLGKFGMVLFDIAWQLAIVVFGGLMLGAWLDERFNSSPQFVLLALGLIVVAFVLILRRTLQKIPRSLGGLKND